MVIRVDSQILKTQWFVDQLWILVWIQGCACLDVWFLRPKTNLDHRSFFSLGRYVNEFIQIISFCEQSSFKLRYETVIGIVLCYSHQAICCFLYYFCEINNGIHNFLLPSHLPVYFWTFILLFPDVIVVSDLNKNIGGSTDLAEKRHGLAHLHSPITPLQQ